MIRTEAQSIALGSAAASDALAYFASRRQIMLAAQSLEQGEFPAWDEDTSARAATELRALADAYHEESS